MQIHRGWPLPGVTTWKSPNRVLTSGSLAGTEMSLQTEEAEERGHKVFEDYLIKVLEKVPKGMYVASSAGLSSLQAPPSLGTWARVSSPSTEPSCRVGIHRLVPLWSSQPGHQPRGLQQVLNVSLQWEQQQFRGLDPL